MALHLNKLNLNPLHPRKLCAKFDWNFFNFVNGLSSPLGIERGSSFEQIWISLTQACFVPCLLTIDPVVLEWDDGQISIRKANLSPRLKWAKIVICIAQGLISPNLYFVMLKKPDERYIKHVKLLEIILNKPPIHFNWPLSAWIFLSRVYRLHVLHSMAVNSSRRFYQEEEIVYKNFPPSLEVNNFINTAIILNVETNDWTANGNF